MIAGQLMDKSEYQSLLKMYNIDGTVATKKPTVGKDMVFLTDARTCEAHRQYKCGECKSRPPVKFNFKFKKVYLPKEESEYNDDDTVVPSLSSPSKKKELRYDPYSGSKFY